MRKLTLVPEWEPCRAVIVTWPPADSDWAYMIDEIRKAYIPLIKTLSEHTNVILLTDNERSASESLSAAGLQTENIEIVEIPLNDTWVRDYGPLTLSDGEKHAYADFKFNAWGLKFAADKDNLVTRRLVAGHLPKGCYINNQNFVLEGGAIEYDGKGTVMTTARCQLSPNRNAECDAEEVRQVLRDALGAEKVIMLKYGAIEGDDTDSHIDTLARFAPGNMIIYQSCDEKDYSCYDELKAMEEELRVLKNAKGANYRLCPLAWPKAIFRDGERLPATYANFLPVNDAVLVPQYGDEKADEQALRQIARCYPGKEIVGIDCLALIAQHGSLHCATMQIPE